VKPPDLGLPWPEWRKGQWEVITQALASPHKYVLIEAPPGIGKSGIALAISRILDARSAHVLTGTLQLQQQYEQLGVTSVTGRPNWQCFIQPGVTAADAPCTAGMKCEYSGPKGLPGCDYFDQKRQASAAAEVVFNYAYWLRQLNYAGWRKPSVLVCDEAHTLAGQVRSFAQTAVRRRALTELGLLQHESGHAPRNVRGVAGVGAARAGLECRMAARSFSGTPRRRTRNGPRSPTLGAYGPRTQRRDLDAGGSQRRLGGPAAGVGLGVQAGVGAHHYTARRVSARDREGHTPQRDHSEQGRILWTQRNRPRGSGVHPNR
jgi:hypothetical protein